MMSSKFVKYKSGYKYQVVEMMEFDTGVLGHDIVLDFLFLGEDGKLIVCHGYAWNGANVVPDESCVMRGSLVHDALYQLMQDGFVDSAHKDFVDRLFQRMIVEDGMSKWRAYLYYLAVKKYGRTDRRVAKVEVAP